MENKSGVMVGFNNSIFEMRMIAVGRGFFYCNQPGQPVHDNKVNRVG